MSNKISRVARMAHHIFSGQLTESKMPSTDQLGRLMNLLNTLTFKDLNFDPRLIQPSATSCAPVVYIHLWESDVFSMGVFVLRPGSRIPLHDHPNMFGVAKLIYGSLRCRSFSQIVSNEPKSLPKSPSRRLVNVVLEKDTVFTMNNDACLVTPAQNNFHELFAVDNDHGGAFLDILAPPYDHESGARECHFYREVELNGTGALSPTSRQPPPSSCDNGSLPSPSSSYLVEIPTPSDYRCDTVEYLGPEIQLS